MFVALTVGVGLRCAGLRTAGVTSARDLHDSIFLQSSISHSDEIVDHRM